MKSAKVEFETVEYPIDYKTIRMLGDENGISMYVIRTYSTSTIYKGLDEKTQKSIFEDVSSITTRTMKIDKASSGWIATIDSHLYHDFRNEKIIEICKLEF